MKPFVLCVLDGWGVSSPSETNSISLAKTPFWDKIVQQYPYTELEASGEFVGLPSDQMGNSEVGHMHIGAGRLVLQDLPRINKAISSREIDQNTTLRHLIETCQQKDSTCHVMGLLSPGGVHSHQDHIIYLCRRLLAEGVKVVMHPFLDGRDTPPKSADGYISSFLKNFEREPRFHIGTIMGRYYGMDRDKRWDRTEKAYQAIVEGKGIETADPLSCISRSYREGITDEFILPYVVKGYTGIQPHDAVLMMNFRADRARQLLTAFVDPSFTAFPVAPPSLSLVVGMTRYSKALDPFMETLFPPQILSHTLGQILSEAGLTQLRIAETEKYAHVTYFFNGGLETVFEREDRLMIPSPKVATYDLAPEMSAEKMTDTLIDYLEEKHPDFVVLNYANPDMVGHTGNIQASIKAVEVIDVCLAKLCRTVLSMGGAVLITADHGNIEQMVSCDGDSPHTAHTLNKVPCVFVSDSLTQSKLSKGSLGDIAPTILAYLGIKIPSEMTGKSLLLKA